ncbi:MAG: nucleotidyl transferase AbiEii/AbiGii toxin family protein [Myxococcales bacterium]|nr:nucleotidyl transferase AbiEii/AbiGii toxin family protein [Myxococcales bacterium]
MLGPRDRDPRQRMLAGFLARLARDADADAFALRGGMLIRQRFPTVGRVARDIDLISSLPFDVEELRGRVRRVLGDGRASDGVVFDADRFRLDAMRRESDHPGIRLYAAGHVDGCFAEMTADFTHRMEVWPRPAPTRLAAAPGRLALCAPAMLIGRKLQVTAELGRPHWRPKDLADLLVMLRAAPPTTAVLGEAVERAFAGRPEASALGDVLGRPSWWSSEHARMRWRRHARSYPRGDLGASLDAVVAEVRERLSPLVSMST